MRYKITIFFPQFEINIKKTKPFCMSGIVVLKKPHQELEISTRRA